MDLTGPRAAPAYDGVGDQSDWGRRTVKIAGFVLIALAAVGAVAVAVVDGLGAKLATEGGVRLVAAGVALLLVPGTILLLRKGRDQLPPSAAWNRPIPVSPAVREITDAMREIQEKYTPAVINLFERMLQAGSTFITRATEAVVLKEGSLQLQTSVDFAMDDESVRVVRESKEECIVIPLMRLKKGVMLDNFELRSADDSSIPTLLQLEAQGLLAFIASTLFRLAYLPESEQTRDLTETEEEVRWALVGVVCHVGRMDDDQKQAHLALMDNPTLQVVDQDAKTRLLDFCDYFSDHYIIPIEAPLPVGSRVILKYSYSTPIHGRVATPVDRWRVRLGLTPRRFAIPLLLPFSAQSYHFRVAADPNQYVWRHKYYFTSGDKRGGQELLQSTQPPPYIRVRRSGGLPYGHLYTRGLHRATRQSNDLQLVTTVDFEEVPPGALTGAGVVALASTVLIWFFLILQPGISNDPTVPQGAEQANSDLPALLLALPAFAATWVGTSAERILRSSIATYLGLAVTGLAAVASSLLYVANANGQYFYVVHDVSLLSETARLYDFDILWLVLAFGMAALTFILGTRVRRRITRYVNLLGQWK